MNAVGIDVSKGKSVVSILRPLGEIVAKPFDVNHTSSDINALVKRIKSIDGDSRIVMEATGHYYESIALPLQQAGLFVTVVNPKIIKDFGNNSIRKVKSDKADSLKIARYALDHWHDLEQFSHMNHIRSQLKLLNRQFNFYTKEKTASKNNLISLLDLTFPGCNKFFDSPVRDDGHQKWIDFASTYWHVDCIRTMSLSAFSQHYMKWCKRNGYLFQPHKPEVIYSAAKEVIAVLPKDNLTKALVKQAVEQLNATSKIVEEIRAQMHKTASLLPEYPVVMAMKGVGPSLGPQLMAEIGDVTRFTHRSALTAFAGVDPGVNESGNYSQKSVPTTKHGSPLLRKTLFQIMDVLIKSVLEDDPVFAFMDKKRAEGKPYYVYMTAGANKFLRIYYGRVKEYLNSLSDRK